ncbi:MAG: DUF523 domain-containing protein [Candidatus Neomarinimicrobiota bacterium]|nr:MAG: DUF523 domain-containing protein [Candidatus Neomarinimicrobiota bacterium]
MKEKVIISGCLAGLHCRYDGGTHVLDRLLELSKRYDLVPVCPEQAGGLATPRIPCELQAPVEKILSGQGKILNRQGMDCTRAFIRGAGETLHIAHLLDIHKAILKEGSPSCGTRRIYDGTFTGKTVPGSGITAKVLSDAGIHIYSEEEIGEML